jgi:hypothetical protein
MYKFCKLEMYNCHIFSWRYVNCAGYDSSPASMYDWKGVREKAGEVDSTNVYVRSDEISRWFLNGCHTGVCVCVCGVGGGGGYDCVICVCML